MRGVGVRAVRLGAAVALGAACLLVGASLATSAPQKPSPPGAVPGELIVGFKGNLADETRGNIVRGAGAQPKRKFPKITANLVSINPDEVAKVEKKLRADPRVRYVEPNYVVHSGATPNDPSFSKLWGLNNTGQSVNGATGTADADIDAPEAWNVTTGSSNVVVAVIDTGVDFSHPELGGSMSTSPVMWVNPGENCGSTDPTIACAQRSNGVDDDHDGYVDDWRGWDFVNGDNNPQDDNEHGTHVTGTIGALGNNGVGVAGVNWHVKVMALKFLDSSGSGTTADAVNAILYAAAHGARVMNNSWGGGGYSQALRDAIATADSDGALFVAAAGNETNDNDANPSYPAAYDVPNVLAVAATDNRDQLAYFSNWGRYTVGLGAPGVDVYSTVPGGGYAYLSGTSMATPHVTGTAALALSEFPSATGVGLKALLEGTTDPTSSLAGKTRTGGRLNAFNAVSCSNAPELDVISPRDGFSIGAGDSLPVSFIGANCGVPSGATATASISPGGSVPLTARGDGLYTGAIAPSAPGSLSVTLSVTAGGVTKTQTINGTVVQNYTAVDDTYSWIDAGSGGTQVPLAVDDGSASVSLPFSFNFYGTPRTSVKISSNGFLHFGSDPADEFANAGIPDASAPNDYAAPLWCDLNLSAGGSVWRKTLGTAPNRRFVVEWLNVPHFYNLGAVTFEAILEEATGDVVFQYKNVNFGSSIYDYGADATIGVENDTGQVGRQFSFDQASLAPYEGAKAIRLTLGSVGPPPTPDTTPPVAPTALTATPGDGSIALDWADNTESDLAHYNVYRQNADTTWSLIASPTASGYTDGGRTNGTTYSYRVTAVDASGNESTPTALTVYLPATAVYKPAGFTIVTGKLARGALTSLFNVDGKRLEILSVNNGGTYVSDFYASTTVNSAQLASLASLRVDFVGNVNSASAALSLRVYNWSTASWETVFGPTTGITTDRSVSWQTSSPAAYVSPSGEVRFSVLGTNTGGFRTRTNLIRFTIGY